MNDEKCPVPLEERIAAIMVDLSQVEKERYRLSQARENLINDQIVFVGEIRAAFETRRTIETASTLLLVIQENRQQGDTGLPKLIL